MQARASTQPSARGWPRAVAMTGGLVASLLLLLPAAVLAAPQERAQIDLDGTWQFQTDPGQVGERDGWAASGLPRARTIQVPGAWQAQGVGEPAGILRHHYAGDAWYRRTTHVPASWKGRRVLLRIGGAHRSTMLIVNGTRVGRHEGFSAPFEFDVSAVVRSGQTNTIAIRISNPGVTDVASPDKQAGSQATGMLNYLANWGGIYSHVQLVATDRMWIDRVLIVPDAERRSARVEVVVAGVDASRAGSVGGPRVRVDFAEASQAGAARGSLAVTSAAPIQAGPDGGRTAIVSAALTDARPWTPDDPHLYRATVTLLDARGQIRDRVEERFGLRTISTRGPTLLLNGRPLYLRGYGDDNIEVIGGFPPASKAVYRERLARAKAFGFNAMRFHSLTPVRELFEAADEVGMLVMAELPVAYTQYVLPHKALLRGELTRSLLAHRNHPSLLSLAFGNEFNLDWLKSDAERQEFLAFVTELYALAKSLDPTRPVMSNDGYHVAPTDMVSLFTGEGKTVPTIRHEFGAYYCSLPDPSLMPRFTGVIAPTWLDTRRAWVEAQGLAAAYPTYVRHSQRLQHLGRQFQIERVRGDARATGYHYWLGTDYPGGTGEGDSWEEGWFDYFWQPKGVTPEEGRRVNSAVLAMIDAGVDQRTFWGREGKTVRVSISNYGDRALVAAPAMWRWLSDGKVLASGAATVDAPLGEVGPAFSATLAGASDDGAAAIDFEVTLTGARAPVLNRWRFWRVPGAARSGIDDRAGDASAVTDDVLVTSMLDARTRDVLEAGGRVLLLAEPPSPPPAAAAGSAPPETVHSVTFFPHPGAAIGTIVRDHPALDGLPHDGFADLQFYNLLQGAGAFTLDGAPRNVEPVVDAVRTATGWLSKSKPLTHSAFLLEATVGRGRLLATTFKVRSQLDARHPDVVWLYERLLRYARSDRFAPRGALTWAQLQAIAAPREVGAP